VKAVNGKKVRRVPPREGPGRVKGPLERRAGPPGSTGPKDMEAEGPAWARDKPWIA